MIKTLNFLILFVLHCFREVCAVNRFIGMEQVADMICMPFINDPSTSPYKSIEESPRNITADIIAEDACESLILSDSYPEVRKAIVADALGYLALRHIQLGIHRYDDVMRHFKYMARNDPANYTLSFRAGFWAMETSLCKYKDAVEFFTNVLYGPASTDKSVRKKKTKLDEFKIRRGLAFSLGYLGKYYDSKIELIRMIQSELEDFEGIFLLKEVSSLLQLQGNESAHDTYDRVQVLANEVIQRSDDIYNEISSHAHNNYLGFKIPQTNPKWVPNTLTSPPTSVEFEIYYDRREIFKLSVGNFNNSFKWQVHKWTTEYLVKEAGIEYVSLQVKPAVSNTTLGFGTDTYLRRRQFKKFLLGSYSRTSKESNDIDTKDTVNNNNNNDNNNNAIENSNEKKKLGRDFEEFLYYQHMKSGNGLLRTPLHKLSSDIPRPEFLAHIWKDMTDVTLWMGHSRNGTTGTACRLHTDPLDNVLFNIRGVRTYHLFSPDNGQRMHTMYPTYKVIANGFPLTYKPKIANITLSDPTIAYYSLARSVDDEVSTVDTYEDGVQGIYSR